MSAQCACCKAGWECAKRIAARWIEAYWAEIARICSQSIIEEEPA